MMVLPKPRRHGYGRKISAATRTEVLGAIRSRYRKASKRDKSRMLDEFVALTGCHRKHAVRLLGEHERSTGRSFEPVTAPVTEPFVATPEEIVTEPLKNRPRPRLRSDADQDSEDATPRSNRAAQPRVVVHENVVRRSVNLETGKEEIEVLDAGDLAVERFSQRPARNRTVSSPATSLSRRTRGAESAHKTGGGARSYTRSCVTGGRSRQGFPPSPRPGRTERRFSARPYVIGQVGLEKRRVVAPGEEPDAPLRQSAIPDGYPFSRAWGEGWDTGSTTRSDTRPHPAPRSGRLSTGRLA